MPTRLQLSQGEVDAGREAGAQLLTRSRAFEDFLADYEGVAVPLSDLLEGQDFCQATGWEAS